MRQIIYTYMCLLCFCDDVSAGLSHYASAYFGEGTGPVLLSDTACTGSEAGLLDCSYSSNNFCSHSQDVGVDCLHS